MKNLHCEDNHTILFEQLEPRLLLSASVLEIQANPVAHIGLFAEVTTQESAAAEFEALALLAAPSSFDLRTGGYVTSVKNQGDCGSCWTFATYGSLESSILLAGGPTRDLSENHLKNYHGFDWEPCDGGNSYISEAYLSRGSGPVDEADDPYHDWDDRPSPGGPPQYYVREALWFDTDDEIKDALMTYGALYTSMYMDAAYYNSSDQTYYYSGKLDANHAVTIVGWDDAKETAAPQDGAWLIKNSWGTSWGDGGYFWIAYRDSKGANSAVSFSDAVPPETFSDVYYYDDFGNVDSLNSPYAFNAFTPAVDEDLLAVGFWTQADGASYDVRVYDTFSGGSLSDLLVSTTGTITYAGYHTIDLPAAVPLTASDSFYVYLNITNGGTYPMSVDYAYPGYSSASTASAGESYYSFDGSSWTDLTTWDSTANFGIKALASDVVNTAPVIAGLPDRTLDEDTSLDNAIDLWAYASDAETSDSGLSFSIVGNTNPDCGVSIDASRYVDIYPVADWHGTSDVTIRVTDPEGLWDEDTFHVTVNDVNDPPSVSLDNIVPSLPEDTDTTSRIKMADIVVTDDGLGTNDLSLSGDDAALFEIDGDELYLQAGVILDYETNPVLDVTVEVDDATVGATPDDTAALAVTVTASATEVILDSVTGTPGVVRTGAWVTGTSTTYLPSSYGGGYWHDGNTGKGTKSVEFTPSLTAAGNYEVFLWYCYSTNPSHIANGVPVDVLHAGVTSTVSVDMLGTGGQWVSLGTYAFDALGSESVTIRTDGTTSYVAADAAKWTLAASQPATEVILDSADGTPGVVRTAAWVAGTSTTYLPSSYDGGYWHDGNTGKGTKSVEFTPSLTAAGAYEVFMWYCYSTNPSHIANGVPVDVLHAGVTATVSVDMVGTGGQWVSLGTYAFDALGSESVTIRTDGTTSYVVADAVKWTPA
ncbi:MAG: lectin like domain-containing protein [Planctomycetota bacterium]